MKTLLLAFSLLFLAACGPEKVYYERQADGTMKQLAAPSTNMVVPRTWGAFRGCSMSQPHVSADATFACAFEDSTGTVRFEKELLSNEPWKDVPNVVITRN